MFINITLSDRYWKKKKPGCLAVRRLWGCCWGRPLRLLEDFQGSQSPERKNSWTWHSSPTGVIFLFFCDSKPSRRVGSYRGRGSASSTSLRSCTRTNFLAPFLPLVIHCHFSIWIHRAIADTVWPDHEQHHDQWPRLWPKRELKLWCQGSFILLKCFIQVYIQIRGPCQNQ